MTSTQTEVRQKKYFWLHSHWPLLASMLAVIFEAMPLIVTQPAPFEDWPSHISRVSILTSLLRGELLWQPYYQINQLFLPNVALDLGVTLLHLIGIPLELSAQLFLLLTFVIFIGGGVALARAFSSSDPVKPMLSAMLFYNGSLMGGSVNFMAGLGLMLWVSAIWLHMSEFPARRFLVAACGVFLVFLAHLIAAFFLIAVIGLLEFDLFQRSHNFRFSNIIRHLSAFSAALIVIVLLWLSPTSTDTLSTDGMNQITYVGAPSAFGIIKAKLGLLGHPLLDGSGGRGAAIVVVGMLVFACAMARTARLQFGIRGIILALGLNVLWIVAPNGVGVGYGLDYRLVPAAFVVLIAVVRIEWRTSAPSSLAMVVMLTFSVCRSASLAADFRDDAVTYRQFEKAADHIIPGSVLLTAIGTPRSSISWTDFWAPPTEYLPTLAVANGVFVPTTFTFKSQHSVVMRPEYQNWRRLFDVSDEAAVAESWPLIKNTCAQWHKDGHAGDAYLVVVYPSIYSDELAKPATIEYFGQSFRLLNLCTG
jgi:hypothetical protein